MKESIPPAEASVASTEESGTNATGLAPGLKGNDGELSISDVPAITEPRYQHAVGLLLGHAVIEGNRIHAYQNGDNIFPAMLEAIRSARHTITLETFIYWSGQIGGQFTNALSECARRGVQVHLLLDWFGAKQLEQRLIQQMVSAGVAVEKFHQFTWYRPGSWSNFNQRTHRKVMVVDGTRAFIGGVGIADAWDGKGDQPEKWRDSHYQVEGPVVGHLQAVFMDNWIRTTKNVLAGEGYFVDNAPCGKTKMQVFKSSPREGTTSVRLMYILALAAAQRSVRISSPYFVPDASTLRMLTNAADRGLQIDIMVPGPHLDLHIVRYGSRSLWGPLLKRGVRIHRFQPAMLHHKIMIVDDYWTSVGSTNLDYRSLHLNDEANLNLFDADFAAQAVATFNEDLKQCKPVSYRQWKTRPWRTRLLDWMARGARQQL